MPAPLAGRDRYLDGFGGVEIRPPGGGAAQSGLASDRNAHHRPVGCQPDAFRKGRRYLYPAVACALRQRGLHPLGRRIYIGGQRQPLRGDVGVGQGDGAGGGIYRQSGGRGGGDGQGLGRFVQPVVGAGQAESRRGLRLPAGNGHHEIGRHPVVRPGRRRVSVRSHREGNRRVDAADPAARQRSGNLHPDLAGAFLGRGRGQGPLHPGSRARVVHDPDLGRRRRQRTGRADHRDGFHRLGVGVVPGGDLHRGRGAPPPRRYDQPDHGSGIGDPHRGGADRAVALPVAVAAVVGLPGDGKELCPLVLPVREGGDPQGDGGGVGVGRNRDFQARTPYRRRGVIIFGGRVVRCAYLQAHRCVDGAGCSEREVGGYRHVGGRTLRQDRSPRRCSKPHPTGGGRRQQETHRVRVPEGEVGGGAELGAPGFGSAFQGEEHLRFLIGDAVGPGCGYRYEGRAGVLGHHPRGGAQHHSPRACLHPPIVDGRPGREPDQLHPRTEQGGQRSGDSVAAESEAGQASAPAGGQVAQRLRDGTGKPVAGNQQGP